MDLRPKKLITFPEAMQAVIDGKNITKAEWDSPDIFCNLESERLKICIHGVFHDWIISEADMMGTDWEVLE